MSRPRPEASTSCAAGGRTPSAKRGRTHRGAPRERGARVMTRALAISLNAGDAEPLAAFCQALGVPFVLLAAGGDAPVDVGAEKIVRLEGDIPPADALSAFIAEMADGFDLIVGVAHMAGKDLLPRIAGLLGQSMVGDIVEVLSASERRFLRPVVAGNAFAEVEVANGPFVASVRATAFKSAARGGNAAVETQPAPSQGSTKRVSVSEAEGGRPDLTQARVVVSGGRPLKDAETFERLIGGLADVLGGAAGATRAAVDSGIAPNDLQVGQTGKVVAPELYVAAGVSGSTQHVAGMKDSKVIVAINTDPDAPIFEIADFGLVMDLFDAIPQLIERLRD
ncbi:MAG: electron transfer flavoprotein subunit alpha [Armatimonadota bacterium]